VSAPSSLAWFARHELRLAWRDWLSMMTAGKRERERVVLAILAALALFLHGVAYVTVAHHASAGHAPGKVTLVVITASALLTGLLMLSQAVESVTRAFYVRSDLDLILASPMSGRKVFSVRIAAIAVSVTVMALLLAAPFINVLAILGGTHWLSAYGVVVAMGGIAAALAVALTVALFRTIGPRRTRLVAQIVAAVIGAGFVIALQVGAIVSYGSVSRFTVLQSDTFVAHAPDTGSPLWWPARAILGDTTALAIVMAAGLGLLLAAVVLFAPRFGDHAVAAAGVAQATPGRRRRARPFRRTSPRHALRRKEWALLRRDPWLLSQTLMQILYLVPPALLLWLGFEHRADGLIMVVPILVMAAGQLAGGLAWLAVSGEDAPDLIVSAPIPRRQVMRAKTEAVLGCVALTFAPLIAALAIASPWRAFATALGIALAAVSAAQIQWWFRAQAKRSQFRRRHTSSRMATFAEALSSIAWAATALLAASGLWIALLTAIVAVGVMLGAKALSPAAATSAP
jgi:ABC-2 type transport system permease protein